MDIVGPLPPSEGNTYLFTIIDRYTRWPAAIPLPRATAETCARALVNHWITSFGVPDDITSDRGTQFTSHLWKQLNKLLGIKASYTTAYHPQANGMIERIHRQLKASLKARATSHRWTDDISLVLLGLRSTTRDDTGLAPCDYVYGEQLRLPAQCSVPIKDSSPGDFIQRLRESIDQLRPPPTTYHGNQTTQLPANLAATGKVYVRRDSHRGPLDRPYQGPFDIIDTGDKYYTLWMNGRQQFVSVDRLKPAFLPTTRSGRVSQPPSRLQAGSTSLGGAL